VHFRADRNLRIGRHLGNGLALTVLPLGPLLSLFPLRAPKARQRNRFHRALRLRLQVVRSLICILVKSRFAGSGGSILRPRPMETPQPPRSSLRHNRGVRN